MAYSPKSNLSGKSIDVTNNISLPFFSNHQTTQLQLFQAIIYADLRANNKHLCHTNSKNFLL